MVLDLKSWRWVRALATIIALGCAPPAQAQGGPCDAAQGIGVEEARLQFVPSPDGRTAWLRLSGRAAIPQDLEPWNWSKTLCAAAVGEGLRINGRPYCSLFEDRTLTGDDRIERAGNLIRFALVTRIELAEPQFRADLDGGQSTCAGRLTLSVRPGPGRRFTYVAGGPRLLSADRAEFEIRPGRRANPLFISLGISYDDAQGDGAARLVPGSLVGPNSWQDSLDGSFSGFGRLLSTSCLVLGVLFLFAILRARVPIPDLKPSLWEEAREPIVVALSLLFAGTLLDAAELGANLLLDWFRHQPDQERDLLAFMQSRAGDRLLTEPLKAALLAGFAIVAWIVHLAAVPMARRRGRQPGPMAEVTRTIFYAAVIASAAGAFGIAIWASEPIPWLGFEGPALLISFGYALLGTSVLAALYGLRTTTLFWISLLVALTVLFPTDPVLRSQSEVAISWHTFAWARFVAVPAADLLYIATLTGLALHLGNRRDLAQAAVGKWLAFLLLLQIGGLSMASPTTVLATAGVLLLSGPWLFPPQGAAEKQAAKAVAPGDEDDPAFPWLVGGAAASIFLLQYVFRAGDEDGVYRFAMLSLSGVLRTFAIGVTAGLLLARAMPLLRGDSATLKAAHISLLILLANMASVLDMLRGRERLVAALTEYMAVIGALILCAVVRFDLARVRTADGGFKWRNLFKGTTLARAVPLVTTVAVAVFTALGPIIVNEIGEAFGDLLKSSLPQDQAGQ